MHVVRPLHSVRMVLQDPGLSEQCSYAQCMQSLSQGSLRMPAMLVKPVAARSIFAIIALGSC